MYFFLMESINLEVKMAKLHEELSHYEPIQGSILLKDNGLHISSHFAFEKIEKRRLAASIAHVFKYFHRLFQIDELTFKWNGKHLYLKHIPAKKIILTTVSDQPDYLPMTELLNRYSDAFQCIL